MAKSRQQRLVDGRLWELLKPLIPPQPPAKGPDGRPRIDDRAVLDELSETDTFGLVAGLHRRGGGAGERRAN